MNADGTEAEMLTATPAPRSGKMISRLGEVICSKRAPLLEAGLPSIVERLERAKKTSGFFRDSGSDVETRTQSDGRSGRNGYS